MHRPSIRARARFSFLALALFAATDCHGDGAAIAPRPRAASAAAYRVLAADAPSERAPGPLLSLTASDGSGLDLVSIEGRAVVDDPLAFTELRLVFDNPEDRVREGTFSITLPTGATVSRFAMKIGDVFQEGEVAPREAARLAYEDFLHRRQDPALLEQAAGNQFSARVFPIPARGRKEIIVSYAQELAGEPYVLPLRGLPLVGRVDVTITRAGAASPAKELHAERVAPASDLVLEGPASAAATGLRSGGMIVARVRPEAPTEPDPLASVVVLVDTSGSRALGFEAQVSLVGRLVREVVASAGPSAQLAVGCFDQTTELVFDGAAGSFGEAELAKIRARGAFGASDLAEALAWAGSKAKQRGSKRVVLVGDGVATAGASAPDVIGKAAATMGVLGVERVDVIAVGGVRDDALLHRLVTAGLARDGVVAESGLDLGRRLTQRTRSGVTVDIPGARWVWPRVLDGVQAGDEVVIHAEVASGAPVMLALGGAPAVAIDLREAERPLVERSIAQAKIAGLLEEEGREGPDPARTQRIVALSVEHRVLSPYTSLLVLETEADYERFHIDRRALSDILTVSGGRVGVVARTQTMPVDGIHVGAQREGKAARETGTGRMHAERLDAPPAGPPAVQPPAADPLRATGHAWGSGGLGLTGIGEGGGGRGEGIGLGQVGTLGHGASPAPAGSASGFGSGHGRLGGAHRTRPPQVRMGSTSVSGRMPPEVIQRVVRQSFGRMRLCYERGLQRDPNLAGRVSVRFVIDRSGAVARAEDAGSAIGDAEVVACVVRSFAGLSFPQPEGGVVAVTYPVQFAPGDGATPRPETMVAEQDEDAPSRDRAAPKAIDAWAGPFKTVMEALGERRVAEAESAARGWHEQSPGDVMALVALGEVLEATARPAAALRAYGSIVDLFPARADLRRYAGQRMERVSLGLGLATDTYEKAEAQRPDHPSSHRLLAFAQLKGGAHGEAFDTLVGALARRYPDGRFAGVERVLREDLGLVAQAWLAAEPKRRAEILGRLATAGGTLDLGPSLRFVLSWETDANDVDLHVHDASGAHAFYGQPKLPGGGELYADVTTGYGPECFVIPGPVASRSKKYDLRVHYYRRGPMGYGMGKLQIIDHDGKGGLRFEERPFVVMVDDAYVDLGSVTR